MLTDQVKRRVPSDIREHFIDHWSSIITPEALTKKLDDYVTVRRSIKRQGIHREANSGKPTERYRISDKPKVEFKKPEPKLSWRDREHFKGRDEIFDKRKDRSCFQCGSPNHFKFSCPELKKNNDRTERVNHVAGTHELDESFNPFLSKGLINGRQMDILRDSGTSLDLVSANYVGKEHYNGEVVWMKQPLDNELRCLPLVEIEIELTNGSRVHTKAAAVEKGTQMNYYLLGNKTQNLIDRSKMKPQHIHAVFTRQQAQRVAEARSREEPSTSIKAVAVIRTEAKTKTSAEESKREENILPVIRTEAKTKTIAEESNREENILPPKREGEKLTALAKLSREQLSEAQKADDSLEWVRGRATVKKSHFDVREGIVVRKTADHRGSERIQIVVPQQYRTELLSLCHEGIGAHLGVNKTKDKILRLYFWPNVVKEVENYVKTCDPCQRSGKARDQVKAPLKLVPIVTTIFSRLCVDCVGPLPESECGNKYMLTAMCMSSHYPEAIPIRDIRSVTVIDALTWVFSRLGYPREVQCDLGTSFVSQLTTEFFKRFGIRVIHSSVHRPQSQAIERWHRTVKRLLKVLCVESGNSWEKNLPYALLALRTVTHNSTGFSPAELIHGKNLRTPETLLYENWLDVGKEEMVVTEYVFELINRMQRCQELAVEKMIQTRDDRKRWYDRDAVERTFKEGDKVLVLALSKPHKLSVNWIGPGTIEKQISATNYIVRVPGRRAQSQVYHVNLLKPYLQREQAMNLIIEENFVHDENDDELEIPQVNMSPEEYDFQNIIFDSDLHNRCTPDQLDELSELLGKNREIFSNDPGKTDMIVHDIELTSDVPVRLKPYRTSPRQNEILKAEIKRMLELGVVVEGESDYNSPMILIESPGRDPRPCIDYRKLNAITRPEIFPLPNIDERVERVAAARFITILDLTKGYWQIPMTERAQRVAAFVTNFGSYFPVTMPFGLVGASYRFSKFMSQLLRGLEEFCLPYLDDMAIFSQTWEDHLKHIRLVLERIKKAKIRVKLSKCKFAQSSVKFLGHMVGQGKRTPAEAKVQAINEFPPPKTKTEIRRLLGMTGYYARYIKDYATLVEPLTNSLKGKDKKGKIIWDSTMDEAFNKLKGKLTQNPVLFAPNYKKEFIIQTDASQLGIGVVLAQRENGEEHPVLFLSRKFSPPERSFGATEKECAGIIFAIRKLRHYIDGQIFTIETDHDPLRWLKNNAGHNPRLIRWALILQPYHYTIRHRAGKLIPHVDCLSRIE